MPYQVALIGATGLVGTELLSLLLDSPLVEKVLVLTRKDLPNTHPKLFQQKVNFENLSELTLPFACQVFISCLGTTIKVAGTQEKFKEVDYSYNLAFAKLALKCNASKYLLISALGADANSSIFYSRIKGELEMAIKQLAIKQTEIFRPSLLLGQRQTKRPGEQWAQLLMPLFNPLLQGPLKKYRPVTAKQVALSVLSTLPLDRQGFFLHENDSII